MALSLAARTLRVATFAAVFAPARSRRRVVHTQRPARRHTRSRVFLPAHLARTHPPGARVLRRHEQPRRLFLDRRRPPSPIAQLHGERGGRSRPSLGQFDGCPVRLAPRLGPRRRRGPARRLRLGAVARSTSRLPPRQPCPARRLVLRRLPRRAHLLAPTLQPRRRHRPLRLPCSLRLLPRQFQPTQSPRRVDGRYRPRGRRAQPGSRPQPRVVAPPARPQRPRHVFRLPRNRAVYRPPRFAPARPHPSHHTTVRARHCPRAPRRPRAQPRDDDPRVSRFRPRVRRRPRQCRLGQHLRPSRLAAISARPRHALAARRDLPRSRRLLPRQRPPSRRRRPRASPRPRSLRRRRHARGRRGADRLHAAHRLQLRLAKIRPVLRRIHRRTTARRRIPVRPAVLHLHAPASRRSTARRLRRPFVRLRDGLPRPRIRQMVHPPRPFARLDRPANLRRQLVSQRRNPRRAGHISHEFFPRHVGNVFSARHPSLLRPARRTQRRLPPRNRHHRSAAPHRLHRRYSRRPRVGRHVRRQLPPAVHRRHLCASLPLQSGRLARRFPPRGRSTANPLFRRRHRTSPPHPERTSAHARSGRTR